MNKEINIGKNIANLRKKHKVTQEQFANAIKVSPQAVSKWETGSCQPDTLTLPLIADYFNVSIDYLFYGSEETSDEIYEQITNRVASMSVGTDEPYKEVLKESYAAIFGVVRGIENVTPWYKNNNSRLSMGDYPLLVMDRNGLSATYPQGFSAVVTKEYLNSIDGSIMERASQIFEALSNKDCLRVTTEILNFDGIGFSELKEITQLDEERLRNAIEIGRKARFIIETESPHAVLGTEYNIQRHHYNCICLILATIKMIELSREGAIRFMHHSKLSMSFDAKNRTVSPVTEESSNE